MSPDARRALPGWARSALRLAVGIGLVAVLLVHLDPGAVLQSLAGIDLRLALPALAGLVAVHVVAAATWWLLTRSLAGDRMPWGDTLRTYYIAQGIGGLTPGNLGSDAYRLLVPASEGGWRHRLGPVAVQRITSSLALAGLGMLALSRLPGSAVDPLVFVLVAALGVGSALALLLVNRRTPWWRARDSAPGWALGRPRHLVRGLSAGLLGGLVFHLVSLALGLLVVASIAPVSQPLEVLACLAVARLAILVPISPSGLGIQEAALSLLFVQIGMSPATALAALLLTRGSLLVTTVLGAVLLALPAMPHARLAASRPDTAPGR